VIERDCTGCELCIPPCPVDCIEVVPGREPEPLVLPAFAEPCIHCGDCAVACPKALAPQQLLSARFEATTPDALRLDDCVLCRRCDRACPSDIPLTDIFSVMKQFDRQRRQDRGKAREAGARHELHVARADAARDRVRNRPLDADDLLASLRERL